jgi:uncharacterized RDD family membrane protein YckC
VLAAAIDCLVLLALFAVSYAVWAASTFLWSPARFNLPTPSRPVVVTASYVVSIVYLSLCWRIFGRTYGDQVIGLRVMNRGGMQLGLASALARATFCVLFPIGLLWTAVSRENWSLADLLLRTSVVYDWQANSEAGGLSDAARP